MYIKQIFPSNLQKIILTKKNAFWKNTCQSQIVIILIKLKNRPTRLKFMKNYFSSIILVLFCLNSISNPQTPTNPWVFKHEKSGIRVFYRDPGTGVYELKLICTVKTSMHAIAALLTDVEAYPSWVYKTSEAWRVRTTDANEMYYYNASDFPWPLDDRDVVVKSRIEQDKQTKILVSASSAVDGLVEVKKNKIRMSLTDTHWQCTPKGNGEIQIEYTLKSDPGGILPAWVINLGLEYGPVETMKAFKTKISEPKYRDAKVDFVVD
jgi:START domain